MYRYNQYSKPEHEFEMALKGKVKCKRIALAVEDKLKVRDMVWKNFPKLT